MHRKWYLKFTILLFLIQMVLPLSQVYAQNNNGEDEPIYLVTESQNGIVMANSYQDEITEAYSLSKVLSIYLIYEAIDNEIISLEDSVEISDEAFSLSQDYDIANVPLRQDGDYKVAELLEPLVIGQANGVILALAEAVAGSEEAFVNQMNQQLTDWGFEGMKLYNATGLPKDFQPNSGQTVNDGEINQLSATALATCTYHLLHQYPEIIEMFKQTGQTFREDTDDSFDYQNELLNQGYFHSAKIDGLFMDVMASEDEERFSAILTQTQSDMQLIVVMLDIPEDQFERLGLQLIQENRGLYRQEHIADAGDPVTQIDAVPIYENNQIQAPFNYKYDFNVIVPREDIAPQLLYQLKPNYQYFTSQDQLMTPVNKGTEVGWIEVATLDKETNEAKLQKYLPSTPGNQALIQVSEDIEAVNSSHALQRLQDNFSSAWREIRFFFRDLFN